MYVDVFLPTGGVGWWVGEGWGTESRENRSSGPDLRPFLGPFLGLSLMEQEFLRLFLLGPFLETASATVTSGTVPGTTVPHETFSDRSSWDRSYCVPGTIPWMVVFELID